MTLLRVTYQRNGREGHMTIAARSDQVAAVRVWSIVEKLVRSLDPKATITDVIPFTHSSRNVLSSFRN